MGGLRIGGATDAVADVCRLAAGREGFHGASLRAFAERFRWPPVAAEIRRHLSAAA